MRKISLRLNEWIAIYVCVFIALIAALVLAERLGVRKDVIGWTLLGFTIILYAVVGFLSRTAVPLQYYIAGRSIPAMHNGMATAADWISAASFISLMGTIYATGYSATVFLMGWTGGFCLLAMLVVPYMRKLGEFTLPDFMVRRYGGQTIRMLSAIAVVACCFVYVVAQLYAVGLIASRMIGVDFQMGIYLGLSSVLLCSFLGGMRAITWTQVAQYIVILLATLLSVIWLSFKQSGDAWRVVDYSQSIQKTAQLQQKILEDPVEAKLVMLYKERIQSLDDKLKDPRLSILAEKRRISAQLSKLQKNDQQDSRTIELEKQLRILNASEDNVIQRWSNERAQYVQLLNANSLQSGQRGKSSAEQPAAISNSVGYERINFFALVLILCLGTVSMPHLLMRYQTTATVAQTRTSVSWTLFFILAVYMCLPPLAFMMKQEVLTEIVGRPIADIPLWLQQWNRHVPELVSYSDVNQDGLLQFRELYLGSDAVMLAMPEIAGMPYAFTALIAAGGLAAALSTADGLLLAMTAVLSRDLLGFSSIKRKDATAEARLDEKSVRERGMLGCKVTLLSVALIASYVAAQRPADIVTLVTLAFSLTAATFFVPVVAGIFWGRANRYGAISAMLIGPVLTLYYWFGKTYLAASASALDLADAYWFGIKPVAAGVFGVAAAAISMVIVTRLTQRLTDSDNSDGNEAIENMRQPDDRPQNTQHKKIDHDLRKNASRR